MKKISSLVVPAAALLLAFGLMLSGCSTEDNTDNSTEVAYTSKDAQGNEYRLVITKGSNKAYAPQEGDAFELTVTKGATVKISRGTVTTISSGIFTLTPTGASTFTVNTSGGNMIGMSGTITYTDNTSEVAPTGTLTPSSGLASKYRSPDANSTKLLIFSESDLTFTLTKGDTEACRGTYTVAGSTVTLTLTSVSDDFRQGVGKNVGDNFTATISGNNLMVMFRQGSSETWTKQQ